MPAGRTRPRPGTRSTSPSISACTRGRSPSTYLGVNALDTSRRTRVWSGCSMSKIPALMRFQNGSCQSGDRGRHGLARHVRGAIYEVRADGDRVTYRVLFATEGKRGQVLLALEAFTKKGRKTPSSSIALAERRLRDLAEAGRGIAITRFWIRYSPWPGGLCHGAS